VYFFFSSRRRHTRFSRDWSSDVCSSNLDGQLLKLLSQAPRMAFADRAKADERRPHLGSLHVSSSFRVGPLSRVRGRRRQRDTSEIGRASCRERVSSSVADVALKRKKKIS